MKAKLEIKNRWTGRVLFEFEIENNTIRKTVEKAIEARANLKVIREDMFLVLLRAIPEIGGLKKAIIEGRIDGSTYSGEYACLCGTLEKSKNKSVSRAVFDQRSSSRPIERFFLGINKGDAPETNPRSAIALSWIAEFEGYISNSTQP